MILVKPSYEIMAVYGMHDPLLLIELAGRTCYKSEDKMTADSAKDFVHRIVKSGHHSVLEHSAMTVRFVVDRGVSHELVRHRLCAFSQESTRYCNYKGGVTFVIPPWIAGPEPGAYWEGSEPNIACIAWGTGAWLWFRSLLQTERCYTELLGNPSGWSPQQARSVLPNSTKTEIVVTANFREWMHIFKLRCNAAAHPQMQEIMIPLQAEMIAKYPAVFERKPNDPNT